MATCGTCEGTGLDPESLFGKKCGVCGSGKEEILVAELGKYAIARLERQFGIDFGPGLFLLSVYVAEDGVRFKPNGRTWGAPLGTVLRREA